MYNNSGVFYLLNFYNETSSCLIIFSKEILNFVPLILLLLFVLRSFNISA